MKQKFFSRKPLRLGLFIIGIVLIVGLLARYEMVNNELHAKINNNAEEIGHLTERVGKYTYNPGSLTECLNNAAKEYEVFIKTNGVVSVTTGGTSYQMSESKWKEADTRLKADQANCEAMFGKSQ